MSVYEIPLAITDLSAPKTVRLSPTDVDRQDIADRLILAGLPAFTAEVTVTPIKKNRVLRVAGRIKAEVTQECVVTLEPFNTVIDTTFDDLYDRDAADLGGEDDDTPWGDITQVPEFLEGDSLDLADIAIQHLSLGLDPFPRKPDAALDVGKGEGISANAPERDNPFAALTALKDAENGD